MLALADPLICKVSPWILIVGACRSISTSACREIFPALSSVTTDVPSAVEISIFSGSMVMVCWSTLVMVIEPRSSSKEI